MKLTFYLRYHTHYGEMLYISGNAPEIGNGVDGIAMQYFNHEYWKLEVEVDTDTLSNDALQYQYYLKSADDTIVREHYQYRTLKPTALRVAHAKVYDSWNFAGDAANVFYCTPFQNILLPPHKIQSDKQQEKASHIFKIKAPLLQRDEVVCLLGESQALSHWDIQNPVLLNFDGEYWYTSLQLQQTAIPLAYKYGIYNAQHNQFVRYEYGGNRVCFEQAFPGGVVLLQDGFLNVPYESWRAAGVAVPVFSLRSKDGLGVGEFNDIKKLADWAAKVGLKMIQLLPVNDTTATKTWKDSYPYAAISAFALHPLYINIEAIKGSISKQLTKKLKAAKKQLNELEHVDYEAVMQLKTMALQELYQHGGKQCRTSDGFKVFFETNQYWLIPYAAFCYLRDRYDSPNPKFWNSHSLYQKEAIAHFFNETDEAFFQVHFHCYVQYQLHLQLSDAVAHAHRKGVIIKGDIPIGMYRYGCDTWTNPGLYKTHLQAGAPPDDFAMNGQNWGFPTYNWQQMHQEQFAWWRDRFRQMSHYFDAFRIDHILGFFRMWSIPIHAVQGIMGRFDPCLPITTNELAEQGIWFDYQRFCTPYITNDVLHEIFGNEAESVKETFLQKQEPQQYVLLPQFDTQQKVATFFSQKENIKNQHLRDGLYDLIGNVILFEEDGSEKNAFHFRIAIDQTSSFRHLPPPIRGKIWRLYIDYFHHRQNDFWEKESLKKLPQLKSATNMLVCGEDLGMVPQCVPGVMNGLGILSLEIQRMPKQQGRTFFHPADAPYLSVVTPSTHDMSTIRGWWQEDKATIRTFYNTELGRSGTAPDFCEPWINRAIVLQHLYSPAMWCVFQLQDLLGMSSKLRCRNPAEERINIPANPQHYWRYRMHLSLEQLLKEDTWNQELNGYIENSGRSGH